MTSYISNHKQSVRLIICIVCIAVILLIGGLSSYAYMTDSQSMKNTLTTATVDVDLIETKWDALTDSDRDDIPDVAEELVQGRVITKDPVVVNKSTLPIYAFIQVQVPKKTVMTVQSAPAKAVTQLFSYTMASDWVLLSSDTSGSAYNTYWYGYKDKVSVNGKTSALFNSVKYANVVEDQISDSDILNLKIWGYGIQSNTFSSMQDAFQSFDKNQSSMASSSDNTNRK